MNPFKWTVFGNYWSDIEAANSISSKRCISVLYSEMFTPVDTMHNKTVSQILDTIAHYYFKNLYDK